MREARQAQRGKLQKLKAASPSLLRDPLRGSELQGSGQAEQERGSGSQSAKRQAICKALGSEFESKALAERKAKQERGSQGKNIKSKQAKRAKLWASP